ncbi:response regulator [Curvibacter sp. RS43]|uniref:HD domain-containing phosphohydrolase n=1 Tax=Curvibacter microcysteis TaxID=3026419 RepID=UPI002360B09D|nr:HD domain-containing phosphohydrolase [Curvibacter sp. RS43]MDD0810972.1 response regulator [Curvibacter sp. RS43]
MSNVDDIGAEESLMDAQSGLATVEVPSLATLGAAEVQPWTVLCVDDEPSILSALRRVLRAEGCRLLVAQGGAEALAVLATESVDVVVSDMRMPGMDGAQLLAQVREKWPGTARILLTGYADIDATIAAINNGQIYRYIHKPWDEHELRLTVRQAAERQQLERERQRLQDLTQEQNQALQELNVSLEARVAERTAELSVANDRLKRNYLTIIRTFSGLLELRGGVLAGHGKRVGDLARRMGVALELPTEQIQDLFVAGLLHDLGFTAIPENVLTIPQMLLAPAEMNAYRRHPVLAAQALMALEDMQGVIPIVRGHHERFDGKGFPDRLMGADIPLGARILAVADHYDDLVHGHITGKPLKPDQAKSLLQRGAGEQFDPEMLALLLRLTDEQPTQYPLKEVAARELKPGMVIGRDLKTAENVVLLAIGQVLSTGLIQRIQRFEEREGTPVTLWVRDSAAPAKAPAKATSAAR